MTEDTRNNFKRLSGTRLATSPPRPKIRASQFLILSSQQKQRSRKKLVSIFSGFPIKSGITKAKNLIVRPFRTSRGPVYLTALLAVILIIFAALYHHAQSFTYTSLSPAAASFVGTSAPHPLKSLKYDAKTKAHTLEGSAPEANSVHVGVNSYSAVLPDKASQGISITDPTTKISLGFAPQFRVGNGKLQGGRMLYPLPNHRNAMLVYTLKNNGVEENLVLNKKGSSDTTSFSYKLNLSEGTEARMMKDGSIGIYGADSMLLGNITTGSDKDKALLDNARRNAKKTTLIYGIPKPTIKGSNNKAIASFKLTGTTLTVQVKGLKKASYPLSIDPSLVLASAAGFRAGNNDDNIAFDDSNNQISRAGLTGGTVGSWSPNSVVSPISGSQSAFVDSGRLYVWNCTSMYYATINATDGTLGSFTSTTFKCSERMFANNGYVYSTGNGGDPLYNELWYSKINSDGSLSAFVQTTSYTANRRSANFITYEGYIYRVGGYAIVHHTILDNPPAGADTRTYNNDTEYAKFNLDGTVGAWAAASSFATARATVALNVYNSHIYLSGGESGNNSYGDVQFATINSDGSLSSWAATSSLSQSMFQEGSATYNGYFYAWGGWTGANNSDISTVQYAEIYANGSLGSFKTTTSLPAIRRQFGAVIYNGYIYQTGGLSGSATITSFTDIQIAKIDPAGTPGAVQTATTFPSGRQFAAGTVYNGYLYVSGGCTANCKTQTATLQADVQYAAINADGSLGAWAGTTNTLVTGLEAHAMTAYNGYLYITGGVTAALTFSSTVMYAPVGANGNTTAAWTTSSNLMSHSKFLHSSVVYNGYLYVTGGNEGTYVGSVMSNKVEYTAIASNGSVGTWAQATPFANGRDTHASVISGGKLYVIGGFNGSTFSDIQYASILSNGSLGTQTCPDNSTATWCVTTALPSATGDVIASVYNGYLYITAGGAGGVGATFLDTIAYAPINANGSIGTFTTSGQHLSSARSLAVGAIYNGWLYLTTGCATGNVDTCTSGYLTTADRMLINNGGPGTTSAWTTAASTFATARSSHTTAVYNGYLYVIGGTTIPTNQAGAISDISYAAIGADGTLGTWSSTTTALPQPLIWHASVVNNGYLYVLGGLSTTGGASSSTYYIPFQSNGDITGSWNNGPSFSAGRSQHSAVVYNNRIYVVGGYDGSTLTNEVQYSTINTSNGSLGSWITNAGGSFSTPRNSFGSVAYNGYLYIIGGDSGTNVCSTTSSALSDVQYAPIDSNVGSIGSWSYTSNLPFTAGFSRFISFASNGFMYIAGGCKSGLALGTVYRAAVFANGNLGYWEPTQNLNSSLSDLSGTQYNGRLYITGGKSGASSSSAAEYASLQSIPRVAHYSRLFVTDKDTTPASFVSRFTSGQLTTISLNYSSASLASPTLGTTTSFSPVSDSKVSFTSSAPQASYYNFSFTLDDSANATFPDNASTPTTLSYFQLNYHPNSSLRLHGGKTFNSNTQQGLDTP